MTSKTSLDSAWAAFLRDTASDRSTWEAFQYAWLARGDLDPTFQQLEAQCQAIWRTNVTLVCQLPKGHEGDHRCGRHTFNGECDIRAMRSDETTDLKYSCWDGHPSVSYNASRCPVCEWKNSCTGKHGSQAQCVSAVEPTEPYHGIGCAVRRGGSCNCAAEGKPENGNGDA